MKFFAKLRLVHLLGLAAGLVVLFTGCSGKNITHSEFMGGYNHEGATKDFAFVESGTDFSSYDRIMLDYLVLFMDRDLKNYGGIQPDELNEAAMAFHRRLIDRLAPDFILVDRPGPRVIRIRSALTNVSFTRPEPNLLTSVFPQNQAVSVRKIPESPNLNLDKAMIEFEFLDSLTQKRLALAVEPCPRVKEAGWLRWEILTKTFDHIAMNLVQKLEALKNQ